MTATSILDTLAREFSARPDHVQGALEMLDAGLCAPFIGRFRRMQVGPLTEHAIRRLDRRRKELEELDRRRATILAMLEREPSVDEATRAQVRACMDRFELEDLFIPHRRPEPEVQLALDRGLGHLADLLVAPVPPEQRAALGIVDEPPAPDRDEPAADREAHREEGGDAEGSREHSSDAQAAPMEAPASAGSSELTAVAAAPEPRSEAAVETAVETAAAVATAEIPSAADMPVAEQETPAAQTAEEDSEEADEQPEERAPAAPVHAIDVKTAMNVHLARLCAPFVNPDRGVHTEAEALSGAVRILSDRLGRNARLRGAVRRVLGKHGILAVRPTVDEGRLGRHRALLRVRAPLRQLQGHRLLAIRQAQKERLVHTLISLDPAAALPKVRAALGRHTHPAHEDLLREIALQALNQRLIPMVEPDVRLELKERADGEALRFLSQHLRQILYASPLGPQPAAGIDVNAKGDWTVAVVGDGGEPLGPETRIEVGEKDAATLGAELRAALEPEALRASGMVVRGIALGHGRGPRAAVTKVRTALRALRAGAPDAPTTNAGGSFSEPAVYIVNESGLSSYASSEAARAELPDRNVPARMAVSLARRLQDPMAEILKVDPRHLGLGSEQGLVSKANARRTFVETIESAAAHVGCDVNRAPLVFLEHVPGLSREAAKKLVERRRERPFRSREELRGDGLLSEAQWTSAVAFLRVPGSPEPLDATGVHPEQYPLVQRLLDSGGTSVEQALGRFGATRGLRRSDFDLDEGTWRDLMREISWPGRDPRPRLHAPDLLPTDVDPVRLVADRVVEGVVSNVASFGVFVDVGLPVDAMVHISEISDRYVRDAREYVSIGQIVRARILDAGGQRLTLSLKHVPFPERARPPRSGGDRPRHDGRPAREFGSAGPGARPQEGRGRPSWRGRRGEAESEGPAPNVRAAQTRRDGLGARSPRRGGPRGGPHGGGGGGGGRGPGRPGGRDDRGGKDAGMGRDERVNLDSINREKGAYSPFASFFKSKKAEEKGE